MNPSPTKQVREWLENDGLGLVHLKHCLQEKYEPEQIADFLHAVVNGMVFEDEIWNISPNQVNWNALGTMAEEIFKRRAQRIVAKYGKKSPESALLSRKGQGQRYPTRRSAQA